MAIDGTQPYDDDNIFAKILRGEIPSTKVYDDEWPMPSKTSIRRPKCTL